METDPVGIATTRLAVLAARNGPTGLLRDGLGFVEGGISELPAMPLSVVDPLRLLRALTAVATTAGPSMDPGLPLRIRLPPVLVYPVRHLARVPSLAFPGSAAARPPNDHRPERHGHRPEQRIRPRRQGETAAPRPGRHRAMRKASWRPPNSSASRPIHRPSLLAKPKVAPKVARRELEFVGPEQRAAGGAPDRTRPAQPAQAQGPEPRSGVMAERTTAMRSRPTRSSAAFVSLAARRIRPSPPISHETP